MFIIKLKYKAPLTEVDKYLGAHREFLDYYYKQGVLIASGPMQPRIGGIIIAALKNQAEVDEIIHKDPYYLAEIADYECMEFTPVKHCESLKTIIQKTEGNLC